MIGRVWIRMVVQPIGFNILMIFHCLPRCENLDFSEETIWFSTISKGYCWMWIKILTSQIVKSCFFTFSLCPWPSSELKCLKCHINTGKLLQLIRNLCRYSNFNQINFKQPVEKSSLKHLKWVHLGLKIQNYGLLTFGSFFFL